MQLKKRPRRAQLAAATLGLLGFAGAQAQDEALPSAPEAPADESSKKWEFDTGVLVYSEADGRVQAAEPVLSIKYDLGEDRLLGGKVVLDSLTGASPNGATPASTPQTFTGPSGNGTYSAKAGELPLDDSFKDTRVALSGDYSFPLSAASRLGFGLNASKEYDFLSGGANTRYSVDFNQHNTTLSAGLSYEADKISPVGGTPVPMSLMPDPNAPPPPPPAGEDDDEGSGETKGVADFVLGLTQVLDPESLVQFNYSVSASSGYHTDPYKVLSVVGADGEPLRYVYESRPDSRTKQAVFARYKRFLFARDVLDLSYRYMSDDWGVKSNTVDATFRWNFGDSKFLEPHLRWYTQKQSDFYHAALYDGEETTVDFASADPRLGAFDGATVGLKYGQTLQSGSQWSARLEYYQQNGKREGVPEQAAAGLAKFDIEPDLSATMLTVGYRFKW